MKQLMKQVLPVLALSFLAACGANETKDTTVTKDSTANTNMDPHAGHDHAAKPETPASSTTPTLKDEKLHAIYQHYVHLTNALINGDAAEAKIAANTIATGAKEIAAAAKIGTSAAAITSASDLEAQRKAFSTLSNEFITLVKKSGLNSGKLYVDYCPMALNDKGAYWISAGEAIKNPYFGEKMMTCGEIKETIN